MNTFNNVNLNDNCDLEFVTYVTTFFPKTVYNNKHANFQRERLKAKIK